VLRLGQAGDDPHDEDDKNDEDESALDGHGGAPG
jgi:hypothetical protein